MKDKKRLIFIIVIGFAIIIAIIGAVLLCQGITKKAAEEYYNIVETAACKYASAENITKELCEGYPSLCKVKYNKLVENEYLDGNLVNPKTRVMAKNDNSNYVEIIWDNDRMVCINKEG